MNLRPTRADVDLDAIGANLRALRALAPGALQLAVVKADAYGHGAVEVARAAIDAGAAWLGVALVEEGVELREAGVEAPILVLVDPPPAAAPVVVAHRLTAGVWSRRAIDALDVAAREVGVRADVHLCVDTGMHREGVPLHDVDEVARYASSRAGLRVEGLWSHFAVADEPNHPLNAEQSARFEQACERVAAAGVDIAIRHLANSAGTGVPGAVHDLVRLGIAIYGLSPGGAMADRLELQPAMRLSTEVASTRRVPAGDGVSYGATWRSDRDTTIANLPIGYGDGYDRALSGTGEVLIGGKRRPIAGRVTMDTVMVDLGDDDVDVGAEAVLIGRQGDDEITADEIAQHLGTINYEVVCSVGRRVPRSYRGGGR